MRSFRHALEALAVGRGRRGILSAEIAENRDKQSAVVGAPCLPSCRSSARCPTREVSRDDRGSDQADSTRTFTYGADGSTFASRVRHPT